MMTVAFSYFCITILRGLRLISYTLSLKMVLILKSSCSPPACKAGVFDKLALGLVEKNQTRVKKMSDRRLHTVTMTSSCLPLPLAKGWIPEAGCATSVSPHTNMYVLTHEPFFSLMLSHGSLVASCLFISLRVAACYIHISFLSFSFIYQ